MAFTLSSWPAPRGGATPPPGGLGGCPSGKGGAHPQSPLPADPGPQTWTHRGLKVPREAARGLEEQATEHSLPRRGDVRAAGRSPRKRGQPRGLRGAHRGAKGARQEGQGRAGPSGGRRPWGLARPRPGLLPTSVAHSHLASLLPSSARGPCAATSSELGVGFLISAFGLCREPSPPRHACPSPTPRERAHPRAARSAAGGSLRLPIGRLRPPPRPALPSGSTECRGSLRLAGNKIRCVRPNSP